MNANINHEGMRMKNVKWIEQALKDGAILSVSPEPDANGLTLYECHKTGHAQGYLDLTPKGAAKQYCEIEIDY